MIVATDVSLNYLTVLRYHNMCSHRDHSHQTGAVGGNTFVT